MEHPNRIAFKYFIDIIDNHGQYVNIRDSEVKEVLFANSCPIRAEFPFMQFVERKLPIQYIKHELIWKLGADPFDDSIKQYAKMWESVQNSDGSFNSNYGVYWFGKQQGLHKAFLELVNDKFSRRAVIPMLSDEHIGHGVKDTVCTGFISFHIRDDLLSMQVRMRSSDVIFGLGTDIPTFSFLMILMYALVKSVYPNVRLGMWNLSADSSHYYERHFSLVDRLKKSDYVFEADVEAMPTCKYDEAIKLMACKGKVDPSWGALSKWLVGE